MKKIFILPVLLLLAFSLTNCEKDDICDANTMTTPRLVIQFYDKLNPTLLKNVTNLKVTGDGLTEPLANFTGVSKISLPLKTTEDITQYDLAIYSTDEININEDKLRFDYTRDNLFVSRACGYKTVFDLDDVTHTDGAAADGLWISSFNIEETNINSEDETHVSIYF